MIRLTREVRFSVDRDWAGHVDFDRPVTNSWAGWPSAVGIVPYLALRASVMGEPDPRIGYVCNTRRLDELLRKHAIPHSAECLRRHGWRMPAEQLLLDLWSRLVEASPDGAAVLVALELVCTPHLRYAIAREEPSMVVLTQQFEFSAAHRLHVPELSAAENEAMFGKCNNANGHGHNYVLEVSVAADSAQGSGVVLPLPRLEEIVQESVIAPLDHKHLNLDCPEFRFVNPSVENIARVVWEMLMEKVAPAALHCVRVYETPKTWAEYRGQRRRDLAT